ncbi:Pterin-4-alpha-carbinolamine dehydratase family protein [Rasamsonia emersonii CBS 393.64]|uniref:4a-hydroxytetrahydrobiopterin dehydratase n=1 Tax=Rasamsonia emersonii (strain ATCC 16479 / CBS 393.64 / IMI 116815) TaxID=1408163 RepID=A0A0F4YFQ7_RASE3|nr:Pterin-4-alpha-carbinolamine dehydratase family protein [Rasamsonia emersonii CBS 393.64]KKA16994.1 Pterin-4-alpha-carbinolamine dehydratase family protein [Rasamsonia emersonii CBS 393.64]
MAAAAAASTAALTLRGLRQNSRSIPIFLSPARRAAIPTSNTRFLSNTPKMTTAFAEADAKEPIFAAGVDQDQFLPQTQALLEEGQWTLDEERMGVTKTFYFKTYTKCLIIGIRSKSKNHHSTMTIKAGSVQVHWTTHHPRGLTDKDIYMAQYCDEQARLIGTVDRSEANKCGPKTKKEDGAGTQ